MTPKEQQANDYFQQGYSCAQSVFAAFHEEMGLDETFALKLMLSMGGGVSGLRETCGAFTAAAMAINMIRPDVAPDDAEGKQQIYAAVQDKAEKFKAAYGTVICRDLLDRLGVTASPAKKTGGDNADRPCAEYVRRCARLVEEELGKG
ncbi:MAG TPA: C-GCAxxG-C-C family protein [Candidatus Limiplasma sp.]|nr:C-GCAxxG-C-C family protein [Candidatus Limiplasma sp.]